MFYEIVFHLRERYLYLKVCLMILCYAHTGWCIYNYDINYLNNSNWQLLNIYWVPGSLPTMIISTVLSLSTPLNRKGYWGSWQRSNIKYSTSSGWGTKSSIQRLYFDASAKCFWYWEKRSNWSSQDWYKSISLALTVTAFKFRLFIIHLEIINIYSLFPCKQMWKFGLQEQ